MSVSKVTFRPSTSCSVDDPLQHAARIMSENDCSIVRVVDAHGTVVGVITARDICIAAYRRCLPLWHMDVGSAMSSRAASAAEGDTENQGAQSSVIRIREAGSESSPEDAGLPERRLADHQG
jgi:signal-transduction protein with cAMP-binding, CBS, and nucleotidyltransferase domain